MRRAADQAQGATAAGQPKPDLVYGDAAGKRIEVRVSYAGELGLEEAVSRYLAARENARALGPAPRSSFDVSPILGLRAAKSSTARCLPDPSGTTMLEA